MPFSDHGYLLKRSCWDNPEPKNGGIEIRLWSLHPIYLDARGLVALWREGLLAKAVLEGRTRGYSNHPQLKRFIESKNPIGSINAYLYHVHLESKRRGYSFNEKKVNNVDLKEPVPVTEKQVHYEFQHLLRKLKLRDRELYLQLRTLKNIHVNPVFQVVPGDVEEWERIRSSI